MSFPTSIPAGFGQLRSLVMIVSASSPLTVSPYEHMLFADRKDKIFSVSSRPRRFHGWNLKIIKHEQQQEGRFYSSFECV